MTTSSENAPASRFKMRSLLLYLFPVFSRSALACSHVDGLALSRAQELEKAMAEMQLQIDALNQAKAHTATVATQTDSYHAAETSSSKWADMRTPELCGSISVSPTPSRMGSFRKASQVPVQEDGPVPEAIRASSNKWADMREPELCGSISTPSRMGSFRMASQVPVQEDGPVPEAIRAMMV